MNRDTVLTVINSIHGNLDVVYQELSNETIEGEELSKKDLEIIDNSLVEVIEMAVNLRSIVNDKSK
jgi:maltodextrin utilization protein YvdJ